MMMVYILDPDNNILKPRKTVRGYASNKYINSSTDFDSNIKGSRVIFVKKETLRIYLSDWFSILLYSKQFRTYVLSP